METEKTREKEPAPRGANLYEESFQFFSEARRRARTGKVVLKGREVPLELSRQGYYKIYLTPETRDVCSSLFMVFATDIKSHSGMHRHQGGLVIYIIEGEGYTLIDGQRVDWESGDLILLPIKPGGIEHQHFSRDPGKPCRWIAFVYAPFTDVLGSEFEQRQESPDWQRANRGVTPG
jgi:hypothetical protein